jgi:hypothetical protein
MAGTLDRSGQRALVLCATGCLAARPDFAVRRDIILQKLDLLVADRRALASNTAWTAARDFFLGTVRPSSRAVWA